MAMAEPAPGRQCQDTKGKTPPQEQRGRLSSVSFAGAIRRARSASAACAVRRRLIQSEQNQPRLASTVPEQGLPPEGSVSDRSGSTYKYPPPASQTGRSTE